MQCFSLNACCNNNVTRCNHCVQNSSLKFWGMTFGFLVVTNTIFYDDHNNSFHCIIWMYSVMDLQPVTLISDLLAIDFLVQELLLILADDIGVHQSFIALRKVTFLFLVIAACARPSRLMILFILSSLMKVYYTKILLFSFGAEI